MGLQHLVPGQPSGIKFGIDIGLKVACAVRPKANPPIVSPNQYVVQVTHSFQDGVRFAQEDNQSALLSRQHSRFLPSELLVELLCFFQVTKVLSNPTSTNKRSHDLLSV